MIGISYRKWRPVVGVLAVGMLAFGLSLQGAPAGDDSAAGSADRGRKKTSTTADKAIKFVLPGLEAPAPSKRTKLGADDGGEAMMKGLAIPYATALGSLSPVPGAVGRATAAVGDPCDCDSDCAGLQEEIDSSGCVQGQCKDGECVLRDAPTLTVCEDGVNSCTIGRCNAGQREIQGDGTCVDHATVEPDIVVGTYPEASLSRCAKECVGGANDGQSCTIEFQCAGGSGCALKTEAAQGDTGWLVTCTEVGSDYDCSMTHNGDDVVRCCETTDPADVGYISSAACTAAGGIALEITDPDDTMHVTPGINPNPRCPQYSSGIAPEGSYGTALGPITPPPFMCNHLGLLPTGEFGAPCEDASDCHNRCAGGINQGLICQPVNEAVDCPSSTCGPDTCVANAAECSDGFYELGDDYSFNTNKWVRFQEIRFHGGTSRKDEVFAFDFYDDSTPPVRVTTFWARFGQEGIGVQRIIRDCDAGCDFWASLCAVEDTRCEIPTDPPRVIPPKGWLVLRPSRFNPATENGLLVYNEFDLNGWWSPTSSAARAGGVDVGGNDGGRMWVNGAVIEAGDAGPLPNGDRIMAFEIVGTELDIAPTGGCCPPGGGACVDTFEHLCRYCVGTGTHVGNVCDKSGALLRNEGSWSEIDRDCPDTIEGCATQTWHGNRSTGDFLVEVAEDCSTACDTASCCETDGTCSTVTVSTAGDCTGDLLPFGTSCSDDTAVPPGPWEPNCCPHPGYLHPVTQLISDPGGGCCADLYQCDSGEKCNPKDSHSCDAPRTGPCGLVCPGAQVLELAVPPLIPLGQRTVLDITTSTVGIVREAGLDDCAHATDPGWFVSWHQDTCAHVTLNLCCNEPRFRPAGSVIPTKGCPCDVPSPMISPNPNRSGYGAAARNDYICGDGNLSIEWTLGPGTYHWEINSGKNCEGTADDCQDETQCAPGVACIDHRGVYQMHIIAEPCRPAACCVITENPADITATCESSECLYLDEYECGELNGDFLGNLKPNPVPDCPNDPLQSPCLLGACCVAGGECDDLDGVKMSCTECKVLGIVFPYHGGLTCEQAPCAICPFEDDEHGQGPTGEYIFNGDLNFGIRVADDLTTVGGLVTRVCYNHAYVPPAGGECADTPADDDLDIRFYEDNYGLPGTEHAESPGAAAEWDARGSQPGFRTWRYSAPIEPAVLLQANECYWMSIQGKGRPDCTLHWTESRNGNNYRARDDNSSWGAEDLRDGDYVWWLNIEIIPAITPWVDGGCGDIAVACCRSDGTCNEENLSTCLIDNGIYFPTNAGSSVESCGDIVCPIPANDDCADAIPLCVNVCAHPTDSTLSSRWSCDTTADCPAPDTCLPWAADVDNGYCANTDLLDDGPVCSRSARDCYDDSPCRPYPDQAPVYRCFAEKDNRLATTDGPPLTAGDCFPSGENAFQADVWHRIDAICTGILVIDECNSSQSYDGMLAVFGDNTPEHSATACPVTTNDELMACNDDFCPGQGTVSGVQVDIVEGNSYLLRTGGWASDGTEATASQGRSIMNIGMICPPPVDVFPPGLPPGAQDQAPKNRYLSIDTTTNGVTTVAWQIDSPWGTGWVGLPFMASNGDIIARVVDVPVYRVWTEETLHVGDCEIAPATVYEISACSGGVPEVCSVPLTIGTTPDPSGSSSWGDVVGTVVAGAFTPPDGFVNFTDIFAVVAYIKGDSVAPPMTWVDLAREVPSGTVDGRDLAAVIEAFQGEPYPGDPSTCSTGGLAARATGTTPADTGPQEDPPSLSCKLFNITTREPLPVTSQGLYRVVPDQRVLMELYLEDAMANLESYQTKLAITRTSGDTGSVSVVCGEAVDICPQTAETTGVEICAFHENAAEVPDFVFAANVLSVNGGTDCPPKLATATLYGGSSVPPEPPGLPGYLASYALDISSDAGNTRFKITFEREEQSSDSASYLLRGSDTAFDPSLQFRPDPGVACAEIVVIGDCNLNGIPDDCDVDSRPTGNLCDQGFCGPNDCGKFPNCDLNQGNLVPDGCQPNTDVDPTIDACDLCQGFDDRLDDDNDTVPDGCDQCPGFNDLNDGDDDDVPDDCDNCPVDANTKVQSDGTPALCAPTAGQFWQLDSDCDSVGDECDRCPGFDDKNDADGDGTPDGCDLCPGLIDTYDCNNNSRPDCLDIDQADGGPCNTGDCSPDCNGNDIPDECDIQGSPSGPTYCTDDCVGCPPSAQPGERCETDCNADGVPDSCHYGDPGPRPTAGNSIKACCTTDEDCLLAVCGPKTCKDGQDVGEECTDDAQCTDSVCVFCRTTVSCMDGVCYARKNRYVSFAPHTGNESVAIQIRLVSMKRCRTGSDFTDETCMTNSDCRSGYWCEEKDVVNTNATSWWVGDPVSLFYEETCSPPCRREDYIARVVGDHTWNESHNREWPAGLIHLGDCEIVPVATYEIRTTTDGVVFGPPLELGTIVKPGALDYGDVVGVVSGGKFTPPQGVINVTDIQAQQITFQGGSGTTAPAHTMWVDLHGQDEGLTPNHLVNVGDLQVIKRGFEGSTTHTQGEGKNPADCQ